MHKWDLICNSCAGQKPTNATKYNNVCTAGVIRWYVPVQLLAFHHNFPGSCPE